MENIMAKLKAHGQELARFVKELPADGNTTERRKVLAIMSDRYVMEKYQVRFAPDQYRPNGELHDWGWHRVGRIKESIPLEDYFSRCLNAGYSRA
jgi:hypothetical protein